jgi:hypothetical protein
MSLWTNKKAKDKKDTIQMSTINNKTKMGALIQAQLTNALRH